MCIRDRCTAPQRDENQLHAAVVELVAMNKSQIKYSTVQNWYPGDEQGKGGIYNFVTKRGKCLGENSKISWTQVETGSSITWKYPSCILMGDNSIGEFYSVAITNNAQQADTGTKMIHIGKNTKSTIISKGISAGKSQIHTEDKFKYKKVLTMHAILLSAILYSLVTPVQHIQYLILINMYQMVRLNMRQLLQKYQKTNCFIVCKEV